MPVSRTGLQVNQCSNPKPLSMKSETVRVQNGNVYALHKVLFGVAINGHVIIFIELLLSILIFFLFKWADLYIPH
jgi:hypothetical protein